MTPHIPVSWGELFDKISILEIKSGRLPTPEARAHVEDELSRLMKVAGQAPVELDADLRHALKAVNEALWGIEDEIREKERRQEFDADFIALARSVYRQNDLRARLKREINLAVGSELIEEKLYAPY